MAEVDEKLRIGIEPHLEPAEELLAACAAAPRGWGQMMASGPNIIAREIAARKQRKSRARAAEAGLPVDAPMALALTSRRLLSFKISVTKMTGKPEQVEALLGAVSLDEVKAITVKRFGLGKRITVSLPGGEAPLEGNRGAGELAEAFAGAGAPA
jgi:hypothetical protein